VRVQFGADDANFLISEDHGFAAAGALAIIRWRVRDTVNLLC